MNRCSTAVPTRIYGPELWRTLHGVELSYWDLWFIVAIADSFGGKRGLVELLKARSRLYCGSGKRDMEAKLSHLLDLETRLLAAGLTHAGVLAEVVVDSRLKRKARTKVLEQGVSNPSPAMIDTPSRLLSERAMRGRWPEFPVDPSKYNAVFDRLRLPRGAYSDYRFTPLVAQQLEDAWEKSLHRAGSPAERLAVSRWMMNATVEIMEYVDDSGGCMGPLFEAILRGYLSAIWESGIEPEVALRDGIEFGIWEDYGLADDMEPFLVKLPPRHGDLAVRVFEETTAELFIHGLEYQYGKALSMWAVLLVAHGRAGEFEYVARRIAADACRPIATMGEAAWSCGRRDVARAVFAAANRPGRYRDRIREACLKVTGEEPPPYRAPLRLGRQRRDALR